MKKLVLIAIFALVFGVFISYTFADETEGSTYTSPNGEAQEFADAINDQDYIDHTHSYTDEDINYDPDYSLGVGVDLVILESDNGGIVPNKITIENKYDFVNNNGSTYAVATYKLADLFKSKK